MIQLIGIIIILNTLLIHAWRITGKQPWSPWFTIVACIIGLALVLHDRALELSFGNFAKIKAAAQQAQSDADAVGELKARIENQSATIDLIAQQAKKTEMLSKQVAENISLAEEKLKMIDHTIAQAQTSLKELELASEYTNTVVAAQNDDRKAFDILEQWSEDKAHPFSNEAQKAWIAICKSHKQLIRVTGLFAPWKEGFDPSTLSLPQLEEQYLNASSQLKPAILEYIWKRNDLPEIDRLDFMMKVMETDENLTVVEHAGYHFTEGTKQRVLPLAVKHLSKWWKENRHEFVEKASSNQKAE